MTGMYPVEQSPGDGMGIGLAQFPQIASWIKEHYPRTCIQFQTAADLSSSGTWGKTSRQQRLTVPGA